MVININFTSIEKIDFLESLGYNIYDKIEPIWEQWGSHDSQGDWADTTITYAKSPKMSSVEYKIDDAFQKELSERLKNILLYGVKQEIK